MRTAPSSESSANCPSSRGPRWRPAAAPDSPSRGGPVGKAACPSRVTCSAPLHSPHPPRCARSAWALLLAAVPTGPGPDQSLAVAPAGPRVGQEVGWGCHLGLGVHGPTPQDPGVSVSSLHPPCPRPPPRPRAWGSGSQACPVSFFCSAASRTLNGDSARPSPEAVTPLTSPPAPAGGLVHRPLPRLVLHPAAPEGMAPQGEVGGAGLQGAVLPTGRFVCRSVIGSWSWGCGEGSVRPVCPQGRSGGAVSGLRDRQHRPPRPLAGSPQAPGCSAWRAGREGLPLLRKRKRDC